MQDGILSAIGKTPLVSLRRVYKEINFNLYGKLELLNPGGSIKDRPAFNIVRHAIEVGAIDSDTVVVESSSGNMGIGLSLACSYYGLRFICVVDPKTTTTNLRLLRAYGAEVDFVDKPDPVTGEFLQARINRVKELLRIIPNSFWPNQYANEHNPEAHHNTMREVAEDLGGQVDFLLCATSTCGTLRGCSEYIRRHGLRTKVYAVDAVGSVIFGGQKLKRLLPGHGAAVVPPLFNDGLADGYIHVSDLDCVVGCHRLAALEALLVGASSGGIIRAVERLAPKIPEGSNCVVLLADRGERYLDTIFSERWVREHFGDVTHLGVKQVEDERCAMTA
ncbi:MAG: 2,3-diaminopropionate biosynthesis protein SbnA [Acidobacteriota bacterium]|nr:2,3-diaminopropionate biosynthesis protein SbnA [Acidobacteriota bacterium]